MMSGRLLAARLVSHRLQDDTEQAAQMTGGEEEGGGELGEKER